MSNKYICYKPQLEALGCAVAVDEPMSRHTSFRIGGEADLFVTVGDSKQLVSATELFREEDVPFFVLGNGSNLLVSDNGIRGAVITLGGEFAEISAASGGVISCGAGVSLSKLCGFALEHSLTGLEFAWGIPGSCGGAAFMNAGAYGGEMKDVIESCEHVDARGNVGAFNREELEFGYRHSVYSSGGYVITRVNLRLADGDKSLIKDKMDDLMNRRKSKQPLEMPSAGSVFKRPPGNYAGTLIEQCGLKGLAVGGAMVSQKHAGFIVNTGGATCRDVLELIAQIQERVKNETGVSLECEVKKTGD